ncbi:hypothetical protein AKJ09_09147 [Labilithrix luteola]|uniref:LPS-assembly protein LptD n=1 Tax=Labilithrix luteola TaxID=1391654 RepID=A0A0K1Q9R8_9BACT|nr:hypothetical protein [Labilithrix luteola]AKV02484.1 hypothetical protein AKJ09_09147 [Labilithrix luteola]
MRKVLACAALATLFVPSLAFAKESPSVDEDEQDNEALEDEALGPGSNLRTRAERISFDARLRTLELSGNVRVDSAPFHLRSESITLSRTRYGIEVDGKGSLAFCPCLGTPLRVDFDHAIVAPPGDLILRSPTLRIYGVPVLYLPYFWLRSDERLGLLPPDIAWRGQDGFFIGEGIHVPWKQGGGKSSLDLRGGAYLVRGYALDTRLKTPSSYLHVRYDELKGASSPLLLGQVDPDEQTDADTGLLLEARGATASEELGVAWDADMIRGRRGVVSTTELDAAAKPWDRASFEAAVHGGPFVVSSGIRAVTRRGGNLGDVDAVGPIARARASGAAASGIAYDLTLEGGALRLTNQTPSATSPSAGTLSFARAEIGALAATAMGPLEASLALRGIGDVTADPDRDGTDRAGSARARLGLPLARAYASEGEPNDPWVHVIEPFAEAAVLHAKGDGLLGIAPGRALTGISGTAPLADVGVSTGVGRWGARKALTVDVAGGAAFGSDVVGQAVRPLGRARVAASLSWLGATVDGGYVLGDSPARSGAVTVAHVRFGPSDGPRVLANVAERNGLDPVLARALSDVGTEPSSGFLTSDGTTGGAGLVVPWSHFLTTSVAADADATNAELVAARGAIELRDRCGCLTLRALAAHRIGRSGVDVWVALDFAADR